MSNFTPWATKIDPSINDRSSSAVIKLNIGSGPNIFPHSKWINYDCVDLSSYFTYLVDVAKKPDTHLNYVSMPEHQKELVDFLRSGGRIEFKQQDLRQGFKEHINESVTAIYIGQVIEHLNPISEIPAILNDCYRMLKKNGILRMTTPNMDLLIRAYLNDEMGKFSSEQPEFYKELDKSSQLAFIMFGSAGEDSTRNNYEGHMFLFTKKSMTDFLKQAGFNDIKFFSKSGESSNLELGREVVDHGVSHSLIVEATK